MGRRCYGTEHPYVVIGRCCYGPLLWDRAALRCYGGPTPLLLPTPFATMGPLLWVTVAMGLSTFMLLWDRAPLCCYGTEHPYVAMGPTPLLVARAVAMHLYIAMPLLCCYDVRPPA